MVIAIFGDSCTGKSTIADQLKEVLSAKIYNGKDYLRLAKNEGEAIALFKKQLESDEMMIYVITEKSQLSFLPKSCIRILVTSSLEKIKERFSKRLNGNLPAPVSNMLQKKYGHFTSEMHDYHIDTDNISIEEAVKKILTYLDVKSK